MHHHGWIVALAAIATLGIVLIVNRGNQQHPQNYPSPRLQAHPIVSVGR